MATKGSRRKHAVRRATASRGTQGGKPAYKLLSDVALLDALAEPVPKKRVREYLVQGWDKELLRTVLNISVAKLTERITGSGSLLPAESERIVLTEQLMARGTKAFGDQDVFMAWLKQPCVPLDGRKPIDLARSATGMAMVLDELTSVEHGIPA